MLRLGLTGGIASGKSAVAAMLREMGFAVLDADSLAHRLIEPGQPTYNEVLQEFGQAVRSEEHTSELQSRSDLVCRLLLEKKKKKKNRHNYQKQHIQITTCKCIENGQVRDKRNKIDTTESVSLAGM